MSAKGKSMDMYLMEVFKQFVALKDSDLKKSQEVFKNVFEQVKQKMGEQCNYFKKFATQVMYAGSVYDGIKVSKLDEFDMDIVIRLPISYEDGEDGITLEYEKPGFVKMKITRPFDNLDKQPDWEAVNKVTRDWRDEEKYFLQSKFRHWIHGIVQKALNEMDGRVDVNGVLYLIKYKTSGPAYTLNVRSASEGDDFTLDVDLVPVIRFMKPRWPEGYRSMNGSVAKEWLVVPKPNRCWPEGRQRDRCWRLSFQDFERELMRGCQQLKNTIRLVKKLRDALGLKAIASYYIKTLFLWKIEKTDKKYWETKISVTFKSMVQELHDAIVAKNIPYFWHKENNLIESLKPTHQKLYVEKLKAVLKSIEANDVDKVVSFLLNPEELKEFKASPFYLSQVSVTSVSSSCSTGTTVSRQQSVTSTSCTAEDSNSQLLANLLALVTNLTEKIDILTERVVMLEEKVSLATFSSRSPLEMEKKIEKNSNVDLQNIAFGVNSISLTAETDHKKEDSCNNVPVLVPSETEMDLLTL